MSEVKRQRQFPWFGIANQMLATIALCVATSAMIRGGKKQYAFVTMIPLVWLVAVTMTAGAEKIFSPMTNVGFLSHAAMLAREAGAPGMTAARAAEIGRLVWNDRIDAALTAFFIAVVVVILTDSTRVWFKLIRGTGSGARGAQQAAA